MCIRFSDQPCNHPSDMTSEQYHWRLVDDFVKNVNKHRAQKHLSMKCCDSHEDDGFAFHWSGQDGHQKIPNVLPVQIGVGPSWGLPGIGGQGNQCNRKNPKWHNKVTKSHNVGTRLFSGILVSFASGVV